MDDPRVGGIIHTVSMSPSHLNCPVPDWNQSLPPPPLAHLALWASCLQKEPYIHCSPPFLLLFSFLPSTLGFPDSSVGKQFWPLQGEPGEGEKGKKMQSDACIHSPSAEVVRLGWSPRQFSVVLPVRFHCWAPQLWFSRWGGASPRLAAAAPRLWFARCPLYLLTLAFSKLDPLQMIFLGQLKASQDRPSLPQMPH